MIISSNLAAKLRIRHVRNDRIARRIDSLCEAARHAPTPAVSVFRRDGTANKSTLKAAIAVDLGKRITRGLHAPTAGMWAPAI